MGKFLLYSACARWILRGKVITGVLGKLADYHVLFLSKVIYCYL